jgi:hypothetical protein
MGFTRRSRKWLKKRGRRLARSEKWQRLHRRWRRARRKKSLLIAAILLIILTIVGSRLLMPPPEDQREGTLKDAKRLECAIWPDRC